jgi:8-oxo-dGTP pyrophosphatase MutT (NUDIX family)
VCIFSLTRDLFVVSLQIVVLREKKNVFFFFSTAQKVGVLKNCIRKKKPMTDHHHHRIEQLEKDHQTHLILQSFKNVIDIERPRKFLTLIYIFDYENKTVLLGNKSRGFGAGKWNGFGGKFEKDLDESIQHSAARELEEECNLYVPHHLLRKDGILYYQYPQELEKRLFEVHCFSVSFKSIPQEKEEIIVANDDSSETDDKTQKKTRVKNEPSASEEMNPIQWFTREAVPMDKMWADDPYWLPKYLQRHLEERKLEEEQEEVQDVKKKNISSDLMFTAAFDFNDFSTVTNASVIQY